MGSSGKEFGQTKGKIDDGAGVPMGAGEVSKQGSSGVAWRGAWRPAVAALVAAASCAQHVESVEVPNRGKGSFSRRRARRKGENRSGGGGVPRGERDRHY